MCTRRSGSRRSIIVLALVATLTTLLVATQAKIHIVATQAKIQSLESEVAIARQQYLALEQEVDRLEQLHAAQQAEIERLAAENTFLRERNLALRETVQKAALAGIHRPDDVREVIAAALPETDQWEYVGVWEGTAYTATREETDRDPEHTAAMTKVAPGYTIAVDPTSWPLGTMFYIEGLGVVCAEDTGSKVMGPRRFDYLVANRKYAFQLGRWQARVWRLPGNCLG